MPVARIVSPASNVVTERVGTIHAVIAGQVIAANRAAVGTEPPGDGPQP